MTSEIRLCIYVLVLCFVTVGIAASSHAVVTYQGDDGTAENAITGGPPFPAALWWATGFTAQPEGNMITHIEIAYGSSQVIEQAVNGTPVTLLLYDDPTDDMDPTDAILLTHVETSIMSSATDTFISVPISLTAVNGDFFVGALVDESGEGWAGWVAAIDVSSGSLQRSWAAENVSALIDPSNVAATSTAGPGLIDDFGFPGNWLIRAVGVPEPSTCLLAILGVAAVSSSRATGLRRCHARRRVKECP